MFMFYDVEQIWFLAFCVLRNGGGVALSSFWLRHRPGALRMIATGSAYVALPPRCHYHPSLH